MAAVHVEAVLHDSLTQPEQFRKWSGANVDIEPYVGGRFAMGGFEESLGLVATVTPEGRPSLSPKGTTTVRDDEHLMFADVSSPGTVANRGTNPHVEVNVVDPIARKGYRFKGTATVDRPGDTFDHALEVFRRRGYST